MCRNNIETYLCGHSIFAGMKLCSDYFKLTPDRTPLCSGIGARNNNVQMKIVRRHPRVCDDCWDETQAKFAALRGRIEDNKENDKKDNRIVKKNENNNNDNHRATEEGEARTNDDVKKEKIEEINKSIQSNNNERPGAVTERDLDLDEMRRRERAKENEIEDAKEQAAQERKQRMKQRMDGRGRYRLG